MMFRYKAEFFVSDNDADLYDNIDKYGKATEHGLVAANSYGEAVNFIVNYYVGKDTDNINSMEIWECENPMADPELSDLLTL